VTGTPADEARESISRALRRRRPACGNKVLAGREKVRPVVDGLLDLTEIAAKLRMPVATVRYKRHRATHGARSVTAWSGGAAEAEVALGGVASWVC
jgi:hypothetical protein